MTNLYVAATQYFIFKCVLCRRSLKWDKDKGGNFFPYWVCGAAVSEVEVDCLTGEHEVCHVASGVGFLETNLFLNLEMWSVVISKVK